MVEEVWNQRWEVRKLAHKSLPTPDLRPLSSKTLLASLAVFTLKDKKG